MNQSMGGVNNVAVGNLALAQNNAANNIAVGSIAMNNNVSGFNNVAIGFAAMQQSVAGSNNVAIGYGALVGSNGSLNVVIGYQAGGNYNAVEANNICIGNSVGGISGESNQIRMGNGTATGCYIAGISGASVTSVGPVYCSASGQLGTVSASSIRYKENVKNIEDGSKKLLSLRPVAFTYKKDAEGTQEYDSSLKKCKRSFQIL